VHLDKNVAIRKQPKFSDSLKTRPVHVYMVYFIDEKPANCGKRIADCDEKLAGRFTI